MLRVGHDESLQVQFNTSQNDKLFLPLERSSKLELDTTSGTAERNKKDLT